MRTFIPALVLVLALASPVAVQTATTPADAPIPVPVLPANADKQALLQAYFQITGQPMFDRLLPTLSNMGERDKQRYANCPAALLVLDTFAEDEMKPHFARWIDHDIKPALLGALDQGLNEDDLRAFLRFAASADGQRYLNQLVNLSGAGDDLSGYRAYQDDPALRQYSAQMKAMLPPDELLQAAMPALFSQDFTAKMLAARLATEQAAKECNEARAD
ncbi:MAG: hypothetical protein Q4G62_09585 [Pseudomonadota bacterium]|nr:hypothetical protein [Pseudomonadota bacterium]